MMPKESPFLENIRQLDLIHITHVSAATSFHFIKNAVTIFAVRSGDPWPVPLLASHIDQRTRQITILRKADDHMVTGRSAINLLLQQLGVGWNVFRIEV